jgi:hypothetical protein
MSQDSKYQIDMQVKRLREVSKINHDAEYFLALIQDFMSGGNSYGYLRVIGLY